jgi:hypothetical protein
MLELGGDGLVQFAPRAHVNRARMLTRTGRGPPRIPNI